MPLSIMDEYYPSQAQCGLTLETFDELANGESIDEVAFAQNASGTISSKQACWTEHPYKNLLWGSDVSLIRRKLTFSLVVS